MILYDFSSCIHRSVYTAIKHKNPHKKDGKCITDEYIDLVIYRIVSEFVDFAQKYKSVYGDFIICLDDHSKPYWRKAIYPEYKATRKKEREESDVNYDEVFKHIDYLIRVLKNFTNFKVIGVPGTEADDIIGLLTRKFARFEKVLILSPDKDFKQLHKLGDIRQYSSITNKWVVPDDLDGWMIEHVVLGDSTDNVPRIVDFTDFTEDFKTHLKNLGHTITENEFYDYDYQTQLALVDGYEGEVFVRPRFGVTGIKKAIKEFGSLDAWLDSNPILRKAYERNRKLVLDSELPAKVEAEILAEYTIPKKQIDIPALSKYFGFYHLETCTDMFKDLVYSTTQTTKFNAYNVNFNNI